MGIRDKRWQIKLAFRARLMFLVNKEAVTGTWPGKGLSLKEERQTHKGATLLDDRVDDIYIIIFASSSIAVTTSSNIILVNK